MNTRSVTQSSIRQCQNILTDSHDGFSTLAAPLGMELRVTVSTETLLIFDRESLSCEADVAVVTGKALLVPIFVLVSDSGS